MTKKYMLIELLHKELIDYPTIININDEIYFINELRKADIDDIRSNIDKFIWSTLKVIFYTRDNE